MTSPTPNADDADPGRRKTVLFCPECPYEGSLADNWRESRTDSTRELVCPACGTVVDRRAERPDETPRPVVEAD